MKIYSLCALPESSGFAIRRISAWGLGPAANILKPSSMCNIHKQCFGSTSCTKLPVLDVKLKYVHMDVIIGKKEYLYNK